MELARCMARNALRNTKLACLPSYYDNVFLRDAINCAR